MRRNGNEKAGECMHDCKELKTNMISADTEKMHMSKTMLCGSSVRVYIHISARCSRGWAQHCREVPLHLSTFRSCSHRIQKCL